MTKTTKRVRRDASLRESLVRAWESSGLSRREFCRQEGLSEQSFGQWARRWGAGQGTLEPRGGGFLEVLPGSGAALGGYWARIGYPDGRQLEFGHAVSGSLLREAMRW